MYLSQALAGAVQAGFAAERETMLSPEHRARLHALRTAKPSERPRTAFRRRGPRAGARAHVPAGLASRADRRAGDAEFVAFQQWWFAELRAAGYAVPHWPAQWGGGMPAAEQVVLYQELAAHDAPRLVLRSSRSTTRPRPAGRGH